LGASYFVGDKDIDVECGRRAGTRTVLVLTGYGRQQDCQADLVCEDANEAVRRILETEYRAATVREPDR